jgi:hypothetical protein
LFVLIILSFSVLILWCSSSLLFLIYFPKTLALSFPSCFLFAPSYCYYLLILLAVIISFFGGIGL